MCAVSSGMRPASRSSLRAHVDELDVAGRLEPVRVDLACHRLIVDCPPVQMIFNVGARRCGTYWLQRITCAHPAVAEVPSETYVFSHGIAPLMERFHHDDPEYEEVGQVYARPRSA